MELKFLMKLWKGNGHLVNDHGVCGMHNWALFMDDLCDIFTLFAFSLEILDEFYMSFFHDDALLNV